MAQTSPVTEGFVATCEIKIDASPETVFEYFVDPDKLTLWQGVAAELDPRPGGIYKVDLLPGRAVARGEYVRIERPHHVTFTFGWEGDDQIVQPGSSTVEVTLVADGEGTLVQLRHSGLPTEQTTLDHTGGWTHYLSRLQVAATGGDPGRDPNLDRTSR